MTFHVLTIFPDFFTGPFQHGVVGRAREAGILDIQIHNLRDWTRDRHKTVDDRPFGGAERPSTCNREVTQRGAGSHSVEPA